MLAGSSKFCESNDSPTGIVAEQDSLEEVVARSFAVLVDSRPRGPRAVDPGRTT